MLSSSSAPKFLTCIVPPFRIGRNPLDQFVPLFRYSGHGKDSADLKRLASPSPGPAPRFQKHPSHRRWRAVLALAHGRDKLAEPSLFIRERLASMSHSVLPRGVYRAPFLSITGEYVVVAVSSLGRALATLNYSDDSDEAPTRLQLKRLLDAGDPVS